MTRHPSVEAIVSELVGTWSGEGNGQYPTIEPFDYRESLEIGARDDHPALRYEQRTWRMTPDGEVVSHWEVGLIRISSDGSVRLNDAQGGRSETMTGSWESDGTGWVLQLRSTGFAGDGRVLGSIRTIRLEPPELHYEMHMETTSTREMSLHLRAILRRAGG